MRIALFTLFLFVGLALSAQRPVFSGNGYLPLLSGDTLPLQYFSGKRVMIVIMPVSSSAADSSFRNLIDSVCRDYSGRLIIIGALSYEDGYGDGLLTALRLPGKLPARPNLIITGGVYTHRASGRRQCPLFDWLTDPQQNGHFGGDVAGAGHIFLLDEQGQLYRVLAPGTTLSAARLEKLL